MWHGVKKIKFSSGRDANKMLMRKLLNNFLLRGTLKTTVRKSKVLKSQIEKVVEKSKMQSEANRNYLMRILNNKQTIAFLFDHVAPVIKKTTGGYVRIVRLGARDSDASEIARCEWAYPIILPQKKVKEEPKVKDNKLEKPVTSTKK